MLVRHPLILEAGVVGVFDERWGERPKAYITVKDENRRNDTGDRFDFNGEKSTDCGRRGRAKSYEQDIIRWAKREISEGGGGFSGFMIPREVEVVPELPKTATGKVKKSVLREWAKRRRIDDE